MMPVGFRGGSDNKESACNLRDPGSILAPYKKSFDPICEYLFLGSVFYSIGLHDYLYASATEFWLP